MKCNLLVVQAFPSRHPPMDFIGREGSGPNAVYPSLTLAKAKLGYYGFYRDLKQRGICVRVGMEATGYSRWFERLLAELGFELWIGDPAEIKAKRVKKQKFDREDARLLLRLLRGNNFPQIWVPGPENRDLRQLLWHRHRLVQMRTRIMNQLHALAKQ